MQFVCKIVKDCVHSDGIRDYQFKQVTDDNLLAAFEKIEGFHLERRELGRRTYVRIFHEYYKIFGFLEDIKLRVEFQDYHPEEARNILETVFTEWTV